MRPLLFSASVLLLTTSLTFAQTDPAEICLFEEDDWAATLAACNEALAASDDPVEQGRFVLHRGLAHEGLGDMQAALLDQILVGEYRPDWFRGYANASSLAFELGDHEAEARWAQAAVDAEPDNPRAYHSNLLLAVYSDEPTSCEPVADQIISLLRHPIDWAFDVSADASLMGDLGYCLHYLERHEEAMTAYLAAEYLGLEAQWFFSDMARIAFYSLEQDHRAIAAATRALSMGETNIDDVAVLVGANRYLGQWDAAIAVELDYADFLNAEDQDFGVRNNLAWALYLDGNIEAASGVAERWHASLDPSDTSPVSDVADTFDTLAHIRAARGEPEGALEAFEQALAREADEYTDLRRDTYRSGMEALGIEVADGEAGLLAGLAECVAMGAECRLFFEGDEAAQEALAAEQTEQ
ncbi:hypothetical protein [Gymnodinialimonas hymeniacidonis]|uniref:tetratricopeptide repeat protein n=1 Tax=Gymnodinialimonas hymeniacidonis TaxID=3126508 RepID=UPI0034C5FC81